MLEKYTTYCAKDMLLSFSAEFGLPKKLEEQ